MALSDRLRRAVREVSEIFRPRDAQFADLLVSQAECAARAGAVLLTYLDSPSPELAQEIASLEEQGDTIQADIQRALREALVTPLAGGDINYLGNAIDDLLDQFEDMVSEDAALEAEGIGQERYREPHYEEVLARLGEAVALLPAAVRQLLSAPKDAERTIAQMRSAYNEGKRAYSLAYAALLRDAAGPAPVRPENRLRWIRLHLRRIEKLANALAGILVQS